MQIKFLTPTFIHKITNSTSFSLFMLISTPRLASFFLLIFSAFFANLTTIFAQAPTGRRGENGGENGNMRSPAIGVITGKVLDAATKQAIEFATISIVRVRDSSVVTGGITDKQGVFTINEVDSDLEFAKRHFIYSKNALFVGYSARHN